MATSASNSVATGNITQCADGVAVGTASSGYPLQVAISGTASVATTGSTAAGDYLTCGASGAAADIGASLSTIPLGTPVIARVLTGGSSSALVQLYGPGASGAEPVACSTCVTAPAPLTTNAFVTGSSAYGIQPVLWSLTGTNDLYSTGTGTNGISTSGAIVTNSTIGPGCVNLIETTGAASLNWCANPTATNATLSTNSGFALLQVSNPSSGSAADYVNVVAANSGQAPQLSFTNGSAAVNGRISVATSLQVDTGVAGMYSNIQAQSAILSGGISAKATTLTASPYTVAATDFLVRCSASTGTPTISIYLPNPPATNQIVIVKKVDGTASSACKIYTAPTSGPNTDGMPSPVTISSQWYGYMLQWDGAEWNIIGTFTS